MDGNLSIPKVPKVTYVNFDAATLAMDDVGERPWDRAFFRDMALALIERGNARVLACLTLGLLQKVYVQDGTARKPPVPKRFHG